MMLIISPLRKIIQGLCKRVLRLRRLIILVIVKEKLMKYCKGIYLRCKMISILKKIKIIIVRRKRILLKGKLVFQYQGLIILRMELN